MEWVVVYSTLFLVVSFAILKAIRAILRLYR